MTLSFRERPEVRPALGDAPSSYLRADLVHIRTRLGGNIKMFEIVQAVNRGWDEHVSHVPFTFMHYLTIDYHWDLCFFIVMRYL